MHVVLKTEARTATVPSSATCINCDLPAIHMHHLIPYIRGGRTLISVCTNCHGKIHNHEFALHQGELVREGQRKARLEGRVPGRRSKFTPEMEQQIVDARLAGTGLNKLCQLHGFGALRILRKHFNGTTGPIAPDRAGNIRKRYNSLIVRKKRVVLERTLENWRQIKWRRTKYEPISRVFTGSVNGKYRRIKVHSKMKIDLKSGIVDTGAILYRLGHRNPIGMEYIR